MEIFGAMLLNLLITGPSGAEMNYVFTRAIEERWHICEKKWGVWGDTPQPPEASHVPLIRKGKRRPCNL